MTKELVKINQENFNAIITKAGDVNSLQFRTIDDKALQEINEWMPVVNQKVSAFSKKNSQTTAGLMSLNMIDSAPYRVLRQILAQVERKRSVLKENLYKIEKKKIKYKNLQAKEELDELEELEMKKIACDIVDAQGPIEASIKEVGVLMRRYQEICKNKNIPENWSEEDFEKQEIEHHIKSIFRNMVRDRLQGAVNQGSQEYAEQFSINPIVAYTLVDDFIMKVKKAISNNNIPDIQCYYEFYDKMYELFKNEYKKGMKRIGLDTIVHSDFLMKDK